MNRCKPAGTSNWKTLILLLKGVITAEEAKNMVYPHSKEYWQDKGTLFYYDKEVSIISFSNFIRRYKELFSYYISS